MSDPTVLRLMYYGLLQRVAVPNKPWDFVRYTNHIFPTREAALERANEYNTHYPAPRYLYKPVEVILEVGLPEQDDE